MLRLFPNERATYLSTIDTTISVSARFRACTHDIVMFILLKASIKIVLFSVAETYPADQAPFSSSLGFHQQ